jgi:hypothetical protein
MYMFQTVVDVVKNSVPILCSAADKRFLPPISIKPKLMGIELEPNRSESDSTSARISACRVTQLKLVNVGRRIYAMELRAVSKQTVALYHRFI